MKRLLAIALLLLAISPVHAGFIFGPLTSGSSQTPPPSGTAPVVTSLACTIALPVTNATNVNLVGGGSCAYTATCNSTACTGMNAITGWAITTQSTANSFSITNAGILQGGSAAGSVTTGSYTVTVTATNTTGTSPGVVQSISVFQPPVVASLSCSIKSPITNNTNVTLQAGGNCQYTATCGGGACSGANAISGWSVVADTCTSCYQTTSSGVLQGSTNAGVVTNQTDTVTVVATNAGGNSPSVAQTVTAVTVPHITNQNFVESTITNPQTIGTMAAAPAATSWSITAVSSSPGGASTSDFAISSGGVITTTSSAPTDVPNPSTVTISMTATNATGTSATGTGTITVGSSCPFGASFPDGCTAAPSGAAPFPSLLSGYATRPPWNVAGVDYNVGPRVTPTKIPLGVTGGNTALPSGATLSGGNRIQITGSNVTMTGWDLTQGAGQSLLVQGNNFTLTDSKLLKTDNSFSMVEIYNNGAVIQYNNFDMNAFTSDSTALVTWHNIGSTPSTGLTWQYNLMEYTGSDFMYPQGTSGTNYALFNYNVVLDAGCQSGSHPDWMQMGGGNYHLDYGYNTLIQHNTHVGSQPLVYAGAVSVQGVINNNMFLSLNSSSALPACVGSSNMNNMFFLDSTMITGTGIAINSNYLDATASSGVWGGTYSGSTFSGNINLKTGGSDNPP